MMPVSKSLKFHAGKVQYNEETNRCTPLPNRGVISIKSNADDPDFLDFTWTPKSDLLSGISSSSTTSTSSTSAHPTLDPSSNNISSSGVLNGSNLEKDELLLIPGDVSIKAIKSCNTGRVFALTFSDSGAKYLYWLQDVGDLDNLDKFTEKDNKLIQQINDLISIDDEEEEEDDDEEGEEDEDKNHKNNNAGGQNTDSMEVDEPVRANDGVNQVEQQTGKTGKTGKLEQTGQVSQGQPQVKLPIGSLSSVLDVPTIESHLNNYSTEQLKQMYSDFLPHSIASNPTKQTIVNDIIRSGFFQQCEQKLSQSLAQGDGTGYLLSQSLKYDYKGEGIENFLNGVRELGKKEKKEKTEEKEEKEE